MKLSPTEFQRVVEHAIVGLKSYHNPIEEHAIKSCGKEPSPISLRVFAEDMLNADVSVYGKMPLVCVKVLERYRSHIECFNKEKRVWESTPFTSYDRFANNSSYRLYIEIVDAEESPNEANGDDATESKRSSGVDMIEV